MTAVQTLRAAGLLSALDEHFAAAVCRIGGDTSDTVLLAAALTSQRTSSGHVCLDLPKLVGSGAPVDESGQPLEKFRWPLVADWTLQLSRSPLVAEASATPLPMRPLVLDAKGRLYLRRYWDHQQRLAAGIRLRVLQTEPLDAALLRDGLDRLDRLFRAWDQDRSSGEPDGQRVAAAVSLHRRFSVISGGPGTGKTFTVAMILALAIDQAQDRGSALPRIRLAAPTGKAAARLGKSIRDSKDGLACEDDVKQAIPDEASTIHRLLGAFRDSDTGFRHHAENPIVADIVLVDESSMVDLALMSRLVDALPTETRLILLGDKDQLASVEAGSILGDICDTGRSRSYSAPFAQTMETLIGSAQPLAADAPRESGIWDCITQLSRIHRYKSDSDIGCLARAINAGKSDKAQEILASPAYPDVSVAAPPQRGVDGMLGDFVAGYTPFLVDAGGPADQLKSFDHFRVLCAHRRGPRGVESVTPQIEAALAERGLIYRSGGRYGRRPVLVTRNDYQLGLFNGDVGIILDEPETGDRFAYFFTDEGQLRQLSPSRLPPHETAFAMSVHRSQGSEFDEVAILLPERFSPVLSRELLYTAVTRAKKRVTIYGTTEMIAAAIARPTERASGLRDELWE